MKTVIPIFFSVNDAYSPFLATAICSIKDNASRSFTYHIHILTDDISAANKDRLSALAEEDFLIEFNSLTAKLASLPAVEQLQNHCFCAFASLTIYFRLFIPELFPQYDKVIYLDADLVVSGDISELYLEHLGTKLVGAVADYSIQKIAPFMHYIDRYVGVDHQNYVNSGVLLLNSKRLREVNFAGCFLQMVSQYGLETVAPDQDYLNALCRYGIHYLDPEWNAMPSECMGLMDDPQIVHFNLGSKPWLNESVPYDEFFWKYAALSGYDKEIRSRRRAFLQDTNAMKNYKAAIKKLIHMAARLADAPVSFRTLMTGHQTLRLCS